MTPGWWALLFIAVAVLAPLLVVGVLAAAWASATGEPYRLDDELAHMHR